MFGSGNLKLGKGSEQLSYAGCTLLLQLLSLIIPTPGASHWNNKPALPLLLCENPSFPKYHVSIDIELFPFFRNGAISTSSKYVSSGLGPLLSPPSNITRSPLTQSQYFVSVAILAIAEGGGFSILKSLRKHNHVFVAFCAFGSVIHLAFHSSVALSFHENTAIMRKARKYLRYFILYFDCLF